MLNRPESSGPGIVDKRNPEKLGENPITHPLWLMGRIFVLSGQKLFELACYKRDELTEFASRLPGRLSQFIFQPEPEQHQRFVVMNEDPPEKTH